MFLRTVFTVLAFVFLTSQVSATRIAGQQLTHVDGLSTIAFPTSGSAEAQPHFIRDVLLMHSFEYEDAAAQFRTARAIDPSFVLAYWGESMTHVHGVWNGRDGDAAPEEAGAMPRQIPYGVVSPSASARPRSESTLALWSITNSRQRASRSRKLTR